MAFRPTSIPVRGQGTESTSLGGERVVLDATGMMLRGLNSTGARVWELVDGQRTAQAIAQQLAQEWGVPLPQAQTDVLVFLEILEGKGLVQTSSG